MSLLEGRRVQSGSGDNAREGVVVEVLPSMPVTLLVMEDHGHLFTVLHTYATVLPHDPEELQRLRIENATLREELDTAAAECAQFYNELALYGTRCPKCFGANVQRQDVPGRIVHCYECGMDAQAWLAGEENPQ
jgi:hypothetical protein